jgi:hypothetical protein
MLHMLVVVEEVLMVVKWLSVAVVTHYTPQDHLG